MRSSTTQGLCFGLPIDLASAMLSFEDSFIIQVSSMLSKQARCSSIQDG